MERFSDMIDRALLILERRGRVSLAALQNDLGVDATIVRAVRDELVDVLEVAEEARPGVLSLCSSARAHVSAEPRHPERRELTILLCDLVASTPLAEALDPEVLSAVMARYQTLCNEVINRYEGHVSQWIGDGVNVYFGYPRAYEDDAVRAVHCGLGILNAITAARAQVEDAFGVTLSVRIGINTGLTVVGASALDSRGGTLAFGETPNIAARIQSLTAPDTVAIGQRTYGLVQEEFAFDPLGPQALKGISKLVEVYRVLAPVTGRVRFESSAARGLTTLIDRDEERSMLRQVCEQVAGGDGRAVLLRGEAGIGKSRLVEAVHSTLATEFRFRFIECQCSPLHRGNALHPILEGIRRHLRLDDDGADERLRVAVGGERATAVLAHALSAPLPAGISDIDAASPQRLRRETLEALVQTVFSAAERGPLAFVVEDVHWADPSTLEVLGSLLARPPGTRLLILMTARPEFAPPWSQGLLVTDVGRLPPEATVELIDAASGGKIDPAVAQRVAERADGVPLFAEELSRAMVEVPARDEEIPTTLYGCLMARLDRDARARLVAQVASVIGREFELSLTETVCELEPEAFNHGLDRLLADGLVARTQEDTFTFHHALLADAARGSLLREVRARYDRQIATTLLERFPELAAQQPERVARHFEWAGDTSEAVLHWQQAGIAALQRSANSEAAAAFDRALRLLERMPDAPEAAGLELSLRVLAALPLVATRGWTAPEVLAHLERAEQLGEVVQGAPQLFPTMLGLVTYRLVSGQLAEAVALGEDQIRVAEAAGDEGLLLEAECEVGNTLAYLARFDESRARLTDVVRLYDPARHHDHAMLFGRDPGAIAYVHLALVSMCLGELDRAQEEIAAALALTERWPHPFSAAWTHACAAQIHFFRGEWTEMHEEAEAAIAISRTEGFPNWEAQALVCRGWARVALGEPAGLDDARTGVAMWEAGGAVLMRPHLLGLLGDALRRVGARAEAATVLQAALDWAAQSGEAWSVPELHSFRAALARDHGDERELRAATESALESARSIGARGFVASATAALERLSPAAG